MNTMGIQQNPYSIRIEEELMKKLRILAKENGRSLYKQIEFSLRKYLMAYEKENGEIKIDLGE